MPPKGELFSLPKPKNKSQQLLAIALEDKTKPLVISCGVAGTGKTLFAASHAAKALKDRTYRKVIITRPTAPVGRTLGHYPGDIFEKMGPWVAPVLNVFQDYFDKGGLESQLKNGNIEVIPFETIRGHSWSNCFVILDEAQNTTIEEMKAFVTRIGDYSKVVINGDVTQSDLKEENGLEFLLDLVNGDLRFKSLVSTVEFFSDDVLRSELCKLFVENFSLSY